MKKPSQKSLAIAISAAVLAGTAATSFAEGALEEVVVTAQKRTQNLQDVPVAVTAFSAEMLRESGIRDMFELSTIAPSLSVEQTQTSSNTTFGIRGIFTSSQNFGLEPSVGLYVDGVYRSRQGSMVNNMVDIASIEVLRGPQGTLFGRNTPAGAILINSVAPDFEGSGYLEGGAGDYGLLNVSGAKSFTLIEDELAVRFTGFNMDRDGVVDAVGNDIQKDNFYNDRNRWGLRFQTLYTPTDDLTLRFIGDHSEINEVCCVAGNWENNFYARNPAPPQKPGTDLTVRDTLGGTVLSGNDFYDYKATTSFKPKSENTDEGISLQADWQTEYFLVTSISAYRKHNAYDKTDGDAYDIDGLARITDLKQEQYSQEIRFSGEAFDSKLNYVTGLYYFYQTLDSTTDTILGEDAYILGSAFLGINPPLPPQTLPAGGSALNTTDQEHNSYAIFGQADYHITDQLVFTAGLRWTDENKEMKNVFTENPDDPVPAGYFFLTELAPRPNIDENLNDSKFTGTLKLSWFLNDRTMFYASYGTGYKAGGINTDRTPPSVDTVFDPETAESYEIGMKAEFPDQALRLNIALHKTDTDDLQTVSFQGAGFALDNAGTAETYGGEVDLLWLPTDNTTITLGYAYNHAEYSDFENGPCWEGTPWQTSTPDPNTNYQQVTNPTTGQVTQEPTGSCDRSGGMVAGNPENVIAITANQQFRITNSIDGFVHGEYIWTDERMTDVNNDPEKLDGSYDVVNLRAGLVYEPWQTTLTFWGRNVFDAKSTSVIADAVAQPGRFIAYYKEPATWGATLRWDF
ncbi:Pesticin receptor [Halioglobus japonicus]|nr:Pesticin receptor [Halioglobus japonicus]